MVNMQNVQCRPLVLQAHGRISDIVPNSQQLHTAYWEDTLKYVSTSLTSSPGHTHHILPFSLADGGEKGA